MPFITIEDQQIPFHLRRSQRSRRLHLIVRSQRIEIVAPLRVSNGEALRFLWQQRSWILKQYRKKTTPSSSHPWEWPANFLGQETVPYRGERLSLDIKYGENAEVVQQYQRLMITIPWLTLTDRIEQTIKSLMLDWYQQQATQIIQQTLDQYCPRLGKRPSGVVLKWQKTRWGSCGVSGKIHINWLLVLAPEGVLEYVVIHELCHLFYRNHGKRFWGKIASCFPDYARYDKWLNKMGKYLLQPI